MAGDGRSQLQSRRERSPASGLFELSSPGFLKVRPLKVHEVFLGEHFVLAVLYVQLRACPVGVYGRAFPDFRQMFSATKKSRVPRPSRVLCGRAGILTSCRSRRCLESGDSPRRGFRTDSAEREEFKIPPSASSGQALSQKPRQGRGTRFPLGGRLTLSPRKSAGLPRPSRAFCERAGNLISYPAFLFPESH
jgi:hypothetical protein